MAIEKETLNKKTSEFLNEFQNLLEKYGATVEGAYDYDVIIKVPCEDKKGVHGIQEVSNYMFDKNLKKDLSKYYELNSKKDTKTFGSSK